MDDITIPESLVQIVAERILHGENAGHMPTTIARASLRAAAPYIAAQALRDAAAEVNGYAYTPDDVREVAHGSDYADGITDAHHVFDRLLNARADRIEATNG